MPGHVQPRTWLVDATPGHVQPCPATVLTCLLSSRPQVRVLLGVLKSKNRSIWPESGYRCAGPESSSGRHIVLRPDNCGERYQIAVGHRRLPGHGHVVTERGPVGCPPRIQGTHGRPRGQDRRGGSELLCADWLICAGRRADRGPVRAACDRQRSAFPAPPAVRLPPSRCVTSFSPYFPRRRTGIGADQAKQPRLMTT